MRLCDYVGQGAVCAAGHVNVATGLAFGDGRSAGQNLRRAGSAGCQGLPDALHITLNCGLNFAVAGRLVHWVGGCYTRQASQMTILLFAWQIANQPLKVLPVNYKNRFPGDKR